MTIKFMLGNHSQGKFWAIGNGSHQVRLQYPYVWVKTDKPLSSGRWYWEAIYLASDDKKNMHIGATTLEAKVYEQPAFNIKGDGYFALYESASPSTDPKVTMWDYIDGKKIPPKVGDVYTFALDLYSGTIAVGRNAPAIDSRKLEISISKDRTITPSASIYSSGEGELYVQFIFGNTSQMSFRYPIPVGYTSYDETRIGSSPPRITKHLLKDHEGYKKYDTNTWHLVSAALPTKEQFQTQGMTALPNLEAIKSLNKPEVFTYTTTANAFQLRTTFIPEEKVIFPKNDLALSTISKIKQVKLTATGKISMIMSNDSGSTWYGLPNQIIDPTNLDDVKEKGLTAEQLTSLTEAEWTAFIGKEKKLRFAYLFHPDLAVDVCQTDVLELIVDMQESVYEARYQLDYEYGYFANDRLKIRFQTDGNYVINHRK